MIIVYVIHYKLLDFVEYICYDDGCHLRKYVQNPKRSHLTCTAEKMASLSIYVDKLHIKGHTDSWCLANCDPREVDDLKGVLTMFVIVHS